MPNEKLSQLQIDDLLRKAELSKRGRDAQVTLITRWPDKSEIPGILTAIDNKRNNVMINAKCSGTKRMPYQFDITRLPSNNDLIYLSPSFDGEFIPCGWFSVEKLRVAVGTANENN